jgi:hypothetical protein
MKTIIAIMLALSSFAAQAEESPWSIQLHGASWHAEERSKYENTAQDWNEVNPGVGIRYELDKTWAVQAGVYRNSIDKVSAYALADWTPIRAGSFSIGLFGGAVTGYNSAPVVAAAGIVARQEFGRFAATWRVTPPVNRPTTVAFEVGFRL